MRRRNVRSHSSSSSEASHAVRRLPRLLSKIDFYPKLHKEVTIQTSYGGALTVAIALFALALFFSELSIYLTPTRTSHVSVDDTLSERLRVNINVTFWALPCNRVELIAMDVAGEATLNVEGLMHKVRLSKSTGLPISGVKITKPIAADAKASSAVPLPSFPMTTAVPATAQSAAQRRLAATRASRFSRRTTGGMGRRRGESSAEQCERERQHPDGGAGAKVACSRETLR